MRIGTLVPDLTKAVFKEVARIVADLKTLPLAITSL